jgi:tRNA pseudouridine55 synthase
MQGVLLVNKSANITSYDVVRQVRKIFQIRKVGHAGTLDPFATGLLIVCLGEATKIVRYLVERPKEYVAVMKFGEATDTQDYTGTVVKRRHVPAYAAEMLDCVVSEFLGEIQQIPPMYSAKRVQGQRLYELARAGNTVLRAPQNVTIYELDLLDLALPFLRFRVVCSKGTYIRTLAHDIGKMVGCGAHLTELTRTRIGDFPVEKAFSLESLAQLTKPLDLERCLISISQALRFFPSVALDERSAVRLVHGGQVAWPEEAPLALKAGEMPENLVRVVSGQHELLALATVMEYEHEGETQWQLQPIRVFVKGAEFADKHRESRQGM